MAAFMTVLVLAIAVGILIYKNVINSPAHQAIKACETYTLGELKSPSSAKFSDEQFFETDDPEVTGSVDSQNGFGAMLRSHFSCSMVNGSDGWTVSDGYVI